MLLVDHEGGVLAVVGEVPDTAVTRWQSVVDSARQRAADATFEVCKRHGHAVVATGHDIGDASATTEVTLVWQDWTRGEPQVFQSRGRRIVSGQYVEILGPPRGGNRRRHRILVNLDQPEERWQLPRDMFAYDILPTGHCIGIDGGEVVMYKFGDGELVPLKRLAFPTDRPAAGELLWFADGSYVLASAPPPTEQLSTLRTHYTQILDVVGWRFLELPNDIEMFSECVAGRDGGRDLLIGRHGERGPWELVQVTERGAVTWTGDGAGVPSDKEPQDISPTGDLLLSRGMQFLFPGDAPRLAIHHVKKKSGRGSLHSMDFTAVGGWLVYDPPTVDERTGALSPCKLSEVDTTGIRWSGSAAGMSVHPLAIASVPHRPCVYNLFFVVHQTDAVITDDDLLGLTRALRSVPPLFDLVSDGCTRRWLPSDHQLRGAHRALANPRLALIAPKRPASPDGHTRIVGVAVHTEAPLEGATVVRFTNAHPIRIDGGEAVGEANVDEVALVWVEE